MRLPDNRVLLTYGYRHEPCGVRARILNAECTDFATAPEIIIRDDADDGDVGYTWAVQLDEKRVLVVYYINFDRAKGTRHIQGSILEIEPQGINCLIHNMMKRKQIPGNMDSSPQKMSRRKALATMAGAVGLAALPGVGHALNPIKKERRDIQTSAFTSIHTMRNAVSRQFTTFDLNTKIKAHLVGPGEKSVLVDHTSPGVITRMWFTINGWFWENWDLSKERWPDPTILKMLILRIYWDGEDYPSVECPIGDFFGIGHCEYKHYMSKYIGMSSGGFYCYFPMPFKKVRIEVENLHHRLTTSVFLNANYDQLESLPEGMGRFHCLYNAGTNPGYEPLTILQTKGHGHFIGCSLSMQSWLPNYLGYLEAPEFIYIDTEDKSVPTIVGSGLEDYF